MGQNSFPSVIATLTLKAPPKLSTSQVNMHIIKEHFKRITHWLESYTCVCLDSFQVARKTWNRCAEA